MSIVLVVAATLALLAMIERYTVRRLPLWISQVLFLLMCAALLAFALQEG
jgi:hypothetical protein